MKSNFFLISNTDPFVFQRDVEEATKKLQENGHKINIQFSTSIQLNGKLVYSVLINIETTK